MGIFVSIGPGEIIFDIIPSLAYNVAKYVKSNAIVITNNFSTIGIGAGQPSRLDSCKIAIQKAKTFQKHKIKNSIAASDAFFPFTDGIKSLIKAGVRTIVQQEVQ